MNGPEYARIKLHSGASDLVVESAVKPTSPHLTQLCCFCCSTKWLLIERYLSSYPGRTETILDPDHHVLHLPQTKDSQIGDHRLITLCRVVERPDNHYGDDLVFDDGVSPILYYASMFLM